MPTSDDWNALGAYVGMFNAGVSFSSAPDPLTIAQFNGNLVAARQTSIGAATTRTLTPSSNHYGKVCQLYFWRNSDGDGFRMAPLVPDSGPTIDTSLAVSITGALGANNSADYSNCVAQWGAPLGWNGLPMSAAQAAASNTRLYRGWLANLNGASVDPIWLADRDMQRVLDRYIASASMHGGTSLIFV